MYLANSEVTEEHYTHAAAKEMLRLAGEMTRNTIAYREVVDTEYEDKNLQLHRCDAGYAQQKWLWKDYAQNSFERFKEAREELERWIEQGMTRYKIFR